MKRVFVCSPYRGDVGANVERARRACRAVVAAGHAPLAPHLLMPQFLDDLAPVEREAGIAAGLAWLEVADEVWVFGEPSPGMRAEIDRARRLGKTIREHQ